MKVRSFVRFVIVAALAASGGLTVYAQETPNEREFTFAQKLLDDGLYSLAGDQFLQFYKTYPGHEKADDALFLSGEAYFNDGRYDQAFESFKDLELTFPQSDYIIRARLRLAECRYRQNDFQAAAELFRRIPVFHRESPQAPQALLRAAEAYRGGGVYERANEVYHDLIRSYPKSPERLEAHRGLVTNFITLRNYELALREIDRVFTALRPDIKDGRLHLLRATIFENMGQIREAEAGYQALIKDFPNTAQAQEAHYRLGVLYRKLHRLERAAEHLDACLTMQADTSLLSPAHLEKAELLSREGTLAEALRHYEKAVEGLTGVKRLRAQIGRARTLTRLNNFGEADAVYAKIFNARTAEEDSTAAVRELIAEAYADRVDLKVKRGEPEEALRLLGEYPAHQPLPPRLLYKRATILERNLREYSRALRTYETFLAAFSRHPLVDEAQAALARCYEHLEDYHLAVQEYDRYLQDYPAGEVYALVWERRQRLLHTQPLDLQATVATVAEALARLPAGEDTDPHLGKIFLDLKAFDRAVGAFKRVVARKADGQVNAEVFFRLGLAYHGLAEKQSLLNDGDLASAYYDSTRISLGYAVQHGQGAVWLQEADFLLAQLELVDTPSEVRAEKLRHLVTAFASRYPDSRHTDWLRVRWARELVDTQTDTAALKQALEQLQSIGNGAAHAEAGYWEAIALHELGQDSLALAHLTRFVENHPKHRLTHEALLHRAAWHRAAGNFDAALADLQRVRERYFYAPAAAQAQQTMAALYAERGDLQQALDLYRQARALWRDFAELSGVAYPAEIDLRVAELLEEQGDHFEALAAYLRFLDHYPQHGAQADAMIAVARIAQALGYQEFARAYYASLLELDLPPQAQRQTHVALGDILFELERYREAREHYLIASRSKESGLERYPTARAIRCLYKMRQIGVADRDAENFKKLFDGTKNEEAQFLLDKARAHLETKNFQTAEKVFEKLKKDFRETPFAAHGAFGLGRIYLTTNHVEKALKTLTRLPEEYPDSEVTPLTYLNLGDFYFNNQQVQNAISAFKQVLAHPKAGENYPKALRYLIKCYDHVQMWDQALALTRDYLARYPDAEDAFSKKVQLGLFMMKLKEYDRAVDHFENLLPYADAETESELQYYVGRAFMEMGDFRRAAAEYLRVPYLTPPSKLPWHVTAQYEAALCFIRLNKAEAAKSLLQQIVRDQGAESNFGRFARQKLEELEKGTESLSAKENF